MFYFIPSGPIWQASDIPQGHPQILETSDQEMFFRANSARAVDPSAVPIAQAHSSIYSYNTAYHQEDLLPRYNQDNTILPEFWRPEQVMSVDVDQTYQTMDPQAQYRWPFPERRKVHSPSTGEPVRTRYSYQSDCNFLRHRANKMSGYPLANQGIVASMPDQLYRWTAKDGQNLDECQVCPFDSVTFLEQDPRSESNFCNLDTASNPDHVAFSFGHNPSSWRNDSPQGLHTYEGPGMTLMRPLALKDYEHRTSTGGDGQVLAFGQPREVLEAVVESDNTTPIATASSHRTFNMKMDPTLKKKRRTFSDAEKQRIKHVRKHGACIECKSKKRKCHHVPDLPNDGPSPQSPDSEDSEPVTPDPMTSSSPINFSPEIDFQEFVNMDFQDVM
ncbi:MAG: hypothetical protein LQ343_005057 [Gyalolechia ehrenbergii]|nr:MAG: hypothetical protein LQ343_005057 [Gyalolechia ehrenbergii]